MIAYAWRLIADEEEERKFLIMLLCVKIIILFGLYSLGFSGISADEYSRSVSAMKWAEAPYLVKGQTAWLPFQLYMNGILLMIFPDPLWVPRITAFMASCVLLLFFYFSIKLLFGDRLTAGIATVGLLFSHWFSWISATPALDTYYMAFFAVALYFGIRWRLNHRTRDLWYAAFSLLLSSGFHYQSWMVLASIDILSLWIVYCLISAKDWRGLWFLIGAFLLSHLYIAYTVVSTYVDVGHGLGFLGSHSSYSKWYYEGYKHEWYVKLVYYPMLLIHNSNPIFGLLALIGLVFVFLDRRKLPQYAIPFILGMLILSGYSIFNVFSVPPTAAPGRFSLIFYIMLLPYSGLAVARAIGYLSPQKKHKQGRKFFIFVLLAMGALLGVYKIKQLPMSPDWNDAVSAGRTLNSLLEGSSPSTGYVVELTYWQHLGVVLTAKHYDRQHFDRKKDIYNRSIPSDLIRSPDKFVDFLGKANIGGMAFRNPKLVHLAKKYGTLVERHNDWFVFAVRK